MYDIIVTPSAKTDGRVLSGCSTNACLASKRLGFQKVGLIGCIGKDFRERFRSDMTRYGIEVRLDSAVGETGGFRLIYDRRGDRTLDVLGIAGKITPRNIPEEFLDSKFFIIGPILGEVDFELVEYIKSSSSAKLFMDPQGMIRLIGKDRRIVHACDREAFKKIAKLVDFIKPNEPESQTITGETDPVRAVRRLSDWCPGISMVTLAERGSLLLCRNELYKIPAFRTDAIDPTGAGDVYAGSFLTEFDREGSPVGSALFASAASSIMVEQVGPDFKISRDAVEKRRTVIRELFGTENGG